LTGSEIFLYLLIAIISVFGVRRVIWMLKIRHYSPFQVAQKLSSKEALVLLDVRTNSERRNGSLHSSIHIPLHELGRRITELEAHRGKEIIVYCQSGNRSLSAAAKLQKNGFSTANMKGGIAEWKFRNLSS